MDIFFYWLGIAFLTGITGSVKGRHGFGWFLLGAIFNLLALLLVVLMPSLKGDSSGLAPSPSTHVRCPDCREFVYKDANKCKHCGIRLVPSRA